MLITGKAFASEAMENKGHCVNEKVIHKLSVVTPDNCCVVEYLQSIAKEGGSCWCGFVVYFVCEKMIHFCARVNLNGNEQE